MAMTADRRATFARQARARFDSDEKKLLPVVEEAIGNYVEALAATLDDVKVLVAAGPKRRGPTARFTVAAADALIARLHDATLFAKEVDSKILPTLSAMLRPILAAGMSRPEVAKSLTTWRNDWLARRRQVLLGVPDQIASELRTALRAAAAVKGTSVDDARLLAQQMLDRGHANWKNRAQLIARTETVGANNQGALAQYEAIAEHQGLKGGTKTWLATGDGRTRADHAALDGTTIPLHAKFDVGGYEMNGPGDESGGAEQVCNCRCTLTYDFPDEGDEVLTAAADPNSGVAIMLGLGLTSEAEVAAPGVEYDPPGLHCTVGYLADPAASYSDEQKTSLLAELAKIDVFPGQAEAFATAHFNPDSDERDPCAVLLVQSQWLDDVRGEVLDALTTVGISQSDAFPIWIPHVAVAYNADPSVIPPGAVGSEIEFNRLCLGWGDEQIIVAGDGAATGPDPSGDDASQMTSAAEAEVTAPTDTAPPEATGGDTAAPTSDVLEPSGVTWAGPMAILAPLGSPFSSPAVASSDGRIIGAEGGTIRPLPQPLSWQRESGPEHDDSTVVGRVLAVEIRTDPALGVILWGSGDYLDPMINFDVEQAMAQVDAGLGFCSVDLVCSEFGYVDENGQPIDPALSSGSGEIYEVATAWEFGGVTIVSFAAFRDARIANTVPPLEAAPEVSDVMPGPIAVSFSAVSDDGTTLTFDDGTTAAVGDRIGIPDYDEDDDAATEAGTIVSIDAEAQTVTVTPDVDDDGVQDPNQTFPFADVTPAPSAVEEAVPPDTATEAALLADSSIRPYRAGAFAKRDLDGPTPITIDTKTGEVYGHAAEFGTCHMGKLAESGVCVTPPQGEDDFSFFHLTPITTDDGLLDVGKITLAAGHAGPGGVRATVSHYDNTATAVAVVRAYEDDYGIQVAGQLIHDTPGPKIEELQRSPLSGDWRKVDGKFRLCAALAVNVPGFPVRRRPEVRVGMAGKEQISLVAAGAVMPRVARTLDEITLPSGRTIAVDDFEAMTAAFADALGRVPAKVETNVVPDELARRRMRAKIALAGRRNVG